MNRALVLAGLAACSVSDLDVTGKQCPCPGGYICNAATNTCARSIAVDAPANDTSIDSLAATSCLPSPLTSVVYTTTFVDAQTAWSAVGGTWTTVGGFYTQTDASADTAYALSNVGGAAYRVLAVMQQASGSVGGALEIAFRGNLAQANMYHCNYEPNDGNLLIQHTDQGVGQQPLIETNLSTVGLDPDRLISLEVQATGTTLECCIRGIANGYVTVTNNLYSSGVAGVKTYDMATSFRAFTVFQ